MFISHLADIHINYSREAEYKEVFDRVADAIPTNDVVLIAGDIFHDKTYYSGGDVDIFNYLLDKLTKNQIIIIPGNHDTNLNDPTKMDLLSPVINRANVHYWKNSGHYKLGELSFYHASVFGDETTEDVIRELQPEEILLYHGIVDGAVFGSHVERQNVITKQVLAKACMTLLGDVHEHQFITPTAAYPGSLIQQNLGESTNKGFIRWDVANRRGSFVKIHNKYGFLRLDLTGKSNDEIRNLVSQIDAPEHLLKLKIITDSDTQIEQLSIIQSKFGHVDVHQHKAAECDVLTQNTICETLRELLIGKGLTPEQAAECVENYTSGSNTAIRRKWSVTSMRWDGLFKYGSDNYIDFTKLAGGISGVIAGNHMGKSSIIDVLIFGLYGELMRGTRDTMINDWCKNSRVRVDFVVNDVDYYVERTDDTKKHAILRLYRKSEQSWINITSETTTKTYASICRLIGTPRQLLLTSIHYRPTDDITQLNNVDCMKSLAELFGLSDNEKIIKSVKEKLRDLKSQISKFAIPRTYDTQAAEQPAADLANMRQKQEESARHLSELEARGLALKALINGTRDPNVVQTSITGARDKLAAIIVPQIHRNVPFAPEITCTPADRELAQETARQPEIVRAELSLAKSAVESQDTESAESLRGKIRRCEEKLSTLVCEEPKPISVDRLTQIGEELAAIQHKPTQSNIIEVLRRKIAETSSRLVSETQFYDESITKTTQTINLAQNKLSTLRCDFSDDDLQNAKSELDSIVIKTVDYSGLEDLQKYVDALTTTYQFEFSDGCAKCLENKSKFNSKIAEASQMLADLKSNIQQSELENVRAANRREELLKTIDVINDGLRNRASIVKLTEVIADRKKSLADLTSKRHQTINDLGKQLSETKEHYLALVDEETAARAENQRNKIRYDELMAEQAEITRQINAHKAYPTIMQNKANLTMAIHNLKTKLERVSAAEGKLARIRELEAELAKSERVYDARARVDGAALYADYLVCKEAASAESRRTALNQELAELDVELGRAREAAASRAELTTISCKIRDLRASLPKLAEEIGIASANLAQLQAELEVLREYNEKCLPLKSEYEKVKKYEDCLGNNGLRVAVIKKYVGKMMEYANELLRELASLVVSCDVTDNSVEFQFKEPGRKVKPIVMGSGFQRFVMSIVMRLSLINVLPSSSDFIIIDEGFGCMDKKYRGKLIEFLCNDYLSAHKFAFIISHIDEIANAIKIPLYIETVSDGGSENNSVSFSRLRNGYAAGLPETPVNQDSPVSKPNTQSADDNICKCTCGAIVKKISMNRHLKTAKHLGKK